MKISCKWLKEFVEIPFSIEELANKLTMTGLEVEDILWQAKNIDSRIITAKIVSLIPHPKSEKLKICKIFTGDETLSVVSGAPNLSMNADVAYAPPGTQFPGKKAVEKISIAGMESCGVLCSEQDLDLVDESEGIIILPDKTKSGIKAADYIETEEAVLEVSVTPNRPDCLSVIGIAREISALTGNRIKLNKAKINEIATPSSQFISITIEDPDLCPSYTGRVIKDIKVSKSPSWMQRRLKASGVRSINNIVDITNYILMETGHPLHAFDYNLIDNKKIIVRRAKENEMIVTLDCVERKMKEGMLLIADEQKGIAIAGVMGGSNTEVTEKTKDILLESAFFSPSGIRKTSKALNLSTEASYRFERGADPEILQFASDRASSLISSLTEGKVCKGLVEETLKKQQAKLIHLREERLNNILGINIPKEKTVSILENLGMQVKIKNEGGFAVTPPIYRHDVENETDLIEEVARINGYENIPSVLPVVNSKLLGNADNNTHITSKIKAELVRMGFTEVINYSFINPQYLEKLGIDPSGTVRIKNPVSEEQSIMRTTLIPGLLINLSLNTKHYNPNIRIFETGKVYFADNNSELPPEKRFVSILISGKAISQRWFEADRSTDFYDIKGILETITINMGAKLKLSPLSSNIPFISKSESADIVINQKNCGYIGKMNYTAIENFELKPPVYVCEIDLDLTPFPEQHKIVFSSLPKIPPSYRDLSIVVDESISAEQIEQCIIKEAGGYLEETSLFDLYKGKPLDDGKKSLAYSLTFRGKNNTLTEQEISDAFNKILSALKTKLKAEIRK